MSCCIECGGHNIVEDRLRGDATCEDCCAVQGPRLIDFDNEEKRTFASDRAAAGRKEDNARTSRTDGISGNLTRIKGDRNPNSKINEVANRISAATNSTVSYKEQKISEGKKGIGTYCDELGLQQNVKNHAEQLWTTFEKSRKKYSRSGDRHMFLAIIYQACKDMNCSRTFKEIAQSTSGDSKSITRAFKRLQKNLQEIQEDKGGNKPSASSGSKKGSSAADTIPRIAEQISLSPVMKSGAQRVARMAAPFLEGKQPSTVAAASILFQIRHITPNETIRDKDVAHGAGIASSTLRGAYKILEENAAALMPKK